MRGEIVIVDFVYTDASGSKVRPALVVQDDRVRSVNTIVAQITTRIGRAGPTGLVVDPTTPDGLGSGLRSPSLISCDNLFTIHNSRILRIIGRLSTPMMLRVDDCLKAALGIP